MSINVVIIVTRCTKKLYNSYCLCCSKRRKTEKVGKGLRHFSMKVCEKVKKKGTTSYNEVADELVGEFTNPAHINSLADQVLHLFHNFYL